MKVIDASGLILGRLASKVAKYAMLGEQVSVINCEKAIVSGAKGHVLAEFKRRKDMGTWEHGPFFPRTSERIVRRTVRGMLPYKETKGELAFKRVKCYTGVPEQFASAKAETFEGAHFKKLPNMKYVSIADVVKFLGGSH